MRKIFNLITSLCLMGTLFSPLDLFAQDQKEETSKKPTDAKDSKPVGKKKKEKKKPYISIAKPKIKNISYLQQRLIIRSAIGVVMKSGKFNMLFSSPKSFEDAKFKFYKLEMSGGKTKWGKNKSGYNLKFKLVDAFTKKTIREVIKTRIEGRQLVFKSKLLQWELIFGKDKAKEVEKEVEAQAEEEILEEEEEEKDKDNKNKDNKKDSGGASAGVGAPPPVNPEDESSEEILAEEEKKKKKKLALEEEEKKKKKKKKKDLKISEFDSPDLDLTKEKLDTTVQPPKPFKVDSQIAFGLDFIEETISSKDIIEVQNNMSLTGLYLDAALRFQEHPTDKLHVGFRMTRFSSENEYRLTPPRTLHLLYKLGFSAVPIHIHGGFEYETQPFAQLGNAGEGIRAWEQSFLWFKGGISVNFRSIFNMKSTFGGYLFKPYIATSNFATEKGTGTVALTGSKFEFFFLQQIWRNYNLKFTYYQSDISAIGSSNLINYQSTTLVSLIYK